jgi:putative acetyltransferase
VEVIIRVYDPRDAADLADVFFRSVRQVALSDYTADQVWAWAPEPNVVALRFDVVSTVCGS